MADNLIFPIGFDLEAAVKKAETEGASALKRLEKVFSRQPLAIQLDTKGFAELGQNIETLKARLKEIKDQWEKMPTAAKFDLDSDGKIKQLTADGKALWGELLRINIALQGVGQGIQQFAAQSSRALQEETRFAEQMREAEIRRYNDAIPGEEISGKISRMELIVRRIFERAQAHPEIVPDLKKLMDYYLPMTVKLLNAYAEMDRQPVQGENIRKSKQEIDSTLDTLNQAFEKLLDSVFEDTAMDVSSDISVLNTLLAQEGLTGSDFDQKQS